MKIFGGFLVYVEKKYYICRIKLKVMWQKCPICNGKGKLDTIYTGYEICGTCDGKKIISELTGFPPAGIQTGIKKDTSMTNLKVVDVTPDDITFDNGIKLYSSHEQDCCESHYLSMADLDIMDFDGLRFDLSRDDFFERVEGYGIALVPTNGHRVRIPGYGYNNGYYSSELTLVLSDSKDFHKIYDISDCQDIND